MSIPLGDKRIVKLTKEEYNLLIIMRYKIPYGEIFVKIHNGHPTFIERGVEKTSLQDDIKNIIGPRHLAKDVSGQNNGS